MDREEHEESVSLAPADEMKTSSSRVEISGARKGGKYDKRMISFHQNPSQRRIKWQSVDFDESRQQQRKRLPSAFDEADELEMLSSAELKTSMRQILTEKEFAVVSALETEIDVIERNPRIWLGDFVESIRKKIHNPPYALIKSLILPTAYDTLQQAAHHIETQLKGEEKQSSSGLSVEVVIDGVLRFLLGHKMFEARKLLSRTMKYFPQDLRLYKMLAYITLHDKSVDTHRQMLTDALKLFDDVIDTDAEIWLLRGDIGRELWLLEKRDSAVAVQAIECYHASFEMLANSEYGLSRHTGQSILKAAVLSSEVYEVEVRRDSNDLTRISNIRDRVHKYCLALGQVLDLVEVQHPELFVEDPEDDSEDEENPLTAYVKLDFQRQHFFHQLFLQIALEQWDLIEKTTQTLERINAKLSSFYTDEDRKHFESDKLETKRLKRELHALVRIIVFAKIKLPVDPNPSHWHPTWNCLQRLFASDIRPFHVTKETLSSMLRGTVGLALSGGGMRAAYLHLGILARLAECDVLRSLDTISAVSGGGLLSAHYYLLMKKLVESKPDAELTKEDYIELVKTLIAQFINGTSQDVISSTLVNPWKNLKCTFGGMTRGVLIAEKFHQFFFAQVDGISKDAKSLRMRDFVITPRGWHNREGFSPNTYNWMRTSKIPVIYFNCTNVNTGHLWRFSAKYMGEDSDMSDDSVDRNTILESVRYDDMANQHVADIALSHCVATSSLLPAFVAPYEIDGMYHDKVVKLVDGGVVDNAGLLSLFHAKTDYIIANEMGARLADGHQPSREKYTHNYLQGPVNMVFRILDIIYDLQFDKLYHEMRGRLATNGVKDAVLIHLRQSHDGYAETEARKQNRRCPPLKRSSSTQKALLARQYGRLRQSQRILNTEKENSVPRSFSMTKAWTFATDHDHPSVTMGQLIRDRVSETRTALDYFTEVERNVLMSVGYSMAQSALEVAAQNEGGQFGLVTDVMPSIDRITTGGVVQQMAGSREEISHLAELLDGTGNGEWGFFDICAAGTQDWEFSRMKTFMDYADSVRIPPDLVYDRKRDAFMDHHQVGDKITEGEISVTDCTDDPSLQRLYKLVSVGSSSLTMDRVFSRSPWLRFLHYVCGFCLVGLIIFVVQMFVELVDTSGFRDRSCWCVLEQPLFYILTAMVFIFLLIYPGYVSRFLFATVAMPIYGGLNVHFYNNALKKQGSQETLLKMHERYITGLRKDV